MTLNSIEIFTCLSSGGFPPAQFQWFIEMVNVTGESVPGDGYSELVYVANKEDNGKNVTCAVKQVEGVPERVTRKILTILCKQSHFSRFRNLYFYQNIPKGHRPSV